MLVVTGKVVTSDRWLSGRVRPADAGPQIYPAQAFVTLQVATLTARRHRRRRSLTKSAGSGRSMSLSAGVIVRCGDKTLAEITRIQTAY